MNTYSSPNRRTSRSRRRSRSRGRTVFDSDYRGRGRGSDNFRALSKTFDIIENAIAVQLAGVDLPVQNLVLSGGFANHPTLLSRLRSRFPSTTFSSSPSQSAKEASEGAIRWFLERFVCARTVRLHWGINTSVPFDAANPEHARRRRTFWPNGKSYVAGAFTVLAERGEVVEEATERFARFMRTYSSPDDLQYFSLALLYSEAPRPPKWCAMSSEGPLFPGVREACTLRVDLSRLRNALRPKYDENGQLFYQLSFQVCVRFGSTQLEARLRWQMPDGRPCEGMVSVIHDR